MYSHHSIKMRRIDNYILMVIPQRGIYFRRKIVNPATRSRTNTLRCHNRTFGLVSLRIAPDRHSEDVNRCLRRLWKVYGRLCTGRVRDSKIRVPTGGLNVLIGYGPNVFKLEGIQKYIPYGFEQFLPPTKTGGDILEGCGIKYSRDRPINLSLTDDIVLQFIASSQLAVYRAIVETWKQTTLGHDSSFKFSKFFSGFQRDDCRSWMGFHDEISNMKNATERKKAIFIHRLNNDLHLRDYWTTGGTYLAYLRIQINLAEWEKISIEQQELMVGRDKESGIPLLGVDSEGKPVLRPHLKTRYTVNSIDPKYLEHPDYFNLNALPKSLRTKLDVSSSIRILSQSHIGRTRHIDGLSSDKPSSRRIYRQGFEFIEPLDYDPSNPIRIGLNFISFQNDPRRLFFILSDPNWMGRSNFGGKLSESVASDLLSVLVSGIFYVPPLEKPFPGVSIFEARNGRYKN